MTDRLSLLARPHVVLIGYVVLVFLLGGGARDDIASLVVLRPLAALVLGFALVIADPVRMRAHRGLLVLAGAWTVLVASHLVPLPPGIWQALPGRELAAEIDRAAGLGAQWRPLSLVPHRTLNGLFALTVPLAALVLAVNCTRRELRQGVVVLVALALAGAVLSLLQVIGGSAGDSGSGGGNPFYLYRITNGDSAVGLFANRNHNAVFLALAIVMLGAVVALRPAPKGMRQGWPLLLGGTALMLVPFLVITQSRAGLVLGVLALGASYWLQRGAGAGAAGESRHRGANAIASAPILAGPVAVAAALALAMALAGLTWLLTAGNALERMTRDGGADDELRLRIWPSALDLAAAHFPAGSGIGTFVEVYETGEPASTLGTSYINHAHNDWLELALTGGLPALVLLGAGALWLIRKGFHGFAAARAAGDRADRALRQLGLVTLATMGLASVYDYPLRTPSLAIVFILALVWIAGRAPESSPEAKPAKESAPREQAHETLASSGM